MALFPKQYFELDYFAGLDLQRKSRQRLQRQLHLRSELPAVAFCWLGVARKVGNTVEPVSSPAGARCGD